MAMALGDRIKAGSRRPRAEVEGRLLAPPVHALVDLLFRNAVGLGDTRAGLTGSVTADNVRIPVDLLAMVRLWRSGGRRVVEHLEDMKRGQPNIEASRGFVAPMSLVSA